ncbi:MAG: hypothetical protein P4L56_01250 [Candidatus Sulfopaludibacter sp.]|nr:hypothetical protein [Candidatus Sulfopaludibacter sp.]
MRSSGFLCIAVVTIAVGTLPLGASSCFSGGIVKTIERSKPQTVALTRKLPPVIDLAGARVRIKVSKMASVKDDPIDVMQTKLRAVLLKDRGRGISLDDPHPDTDLIVKVTTFETAEQKQQRQNGNETSSYIVILGNMEATVEVFDIKSGRALDSENLKDHYEKWFLTGTVQNGSKGMPNPFAKKPKTSTDDRLPTASERISDVVEGMANKIAQRLVPIDDRFDVELPYGLKDLDSYARAGNWGALKEAAESMTPLPKAEEDSCRLYLVGLSSEAIAYQEKDPKKAQDLLVNAADAYQKAKDSNRSEEKFNEPISRAQQSLERYITLEKIARSHQGTQSRGVKVTQAGNSVVTSPPSGGSGPAPVGAAAKMVYDNAYLIKLKNINKMSDRLIISEVQDANPPQFDISPNGIAQLLTANMSEDVILAVKNKMKSRTAPPPAKKK